MPRTIFEFELEFLTPAFPGGADPGQKAEFTAKSLKSLMRYWWRQFHGWQDTGELFRKESLIFGSTSNGAGFSIHFTDYSSIIFDTSGNAFQAPNNSGMAYLFYTCIGKGPRQPGRKEWILEHSKTQFKLTFLLDNPTIIKQVLLSIWLAQTFGGIGTRSRRGAGSFQVTLKNINTTEVSLKKNAEELFPLNSSDLHQIVTRNKPDPGCFDLFDPSSPIIYAMETPDCFKKFGPQKSPVAILDLLGEAMKNERSCFTYNFRSSDPVHKQARDLHLTGLSSSYTGLNPIGKTAFGLPIVLNFKQRKQDPRTGRISLCRNAEGKTIPEDWQIILRPANFERRASPLLPLTFYSPPFDNL